MEAENPAVSPWGRADDVGEMTVNIPLRVTIGVGALHVPGQVPAGEGMLATLANIPAGGLRAGDVLLYRGSGVISMAIRFFDGGDVSHAGFFVGSGEVIEAIAEGVVRRSLTSSTAGAEWVKVLRLKAPPADMGPVSARGAFYFGQGNRYAYEQIVLLAFLILIRKVSPNPVLFWLVRNVIALATGFLNRLLGGGRQPMICSELVYRAYDEALPAPDDPYTIHIPNLPFALAQGAAGPGRGEGVHPDSLLAWAAASAGPTWDREVERLNARLATTEATDEAVLRRGLEQAIGHYIRAAQGEEATTVPQVTEEELRTEIARFATSLYAVNVAQGRLEGQSAPGMVSGAGVLALVTEELAQQRLSLPGVFANFFKTAADFVTPNDLAKTQSLITLGTLR